VLWGIGLQVRASDTGCSLLWVYVEVVRCRVSTGHWSRSLPCGGWNDENILVFITLRLFDVSRGSPVGLGNLRNLVCTQ
jgi:hypothetical protein